MKAIDAIKRALQLGDMMIVQRIGDMRDACLTAPTPRGGNHPLWVLGHIAFIESDLPNVLFGEGNPVEHWAPIFAPGSEPVADAKAYPPFDEVMAAYRTARARNLAILDELGEAGLDRPTVAPPAGLESFLDTAGNTFLTIALHHMSHLGQVADARRAAGRSPMFTPGRAMRRPAAAVA